MTLITPLPACMSFRHRAGESNLAAIVPPPKKRSGSTKKNQKSSRNLLFLINYSPQQNFIATTFGAPRESLHIAINVEPAAPASKKLLTQQQRRIKRGSANIQLTRGRRIKRQPIARRPAHGCGKIRMRAAARATAASLFLLPDEQAKNISRYKSLR